jgi:dUTP pyrophosphatase
MESPMNYTLPVKRLHPDAQLPQRTRDHDAGLDLRCLHAFTLQPGERQVVDTGVAVQLPEHLCGLVVPRSGLAAKHGITVVNAPGLIDPTYRGEIKAILLNTGAEPFAADAGDRVCQLLLVPFAAGPVVEADELTDSADGRGDGGLGSSGVK